MQIYGKTGFAFLSAAALFLFAAVPQTVSAQNLQNVVLTQISATEWTAVDQSMTVTFRPCEDNNQMLCGYLKTATPEAAKRFGLTQSPEKLRGMRIIEGLRYDGGSRLQGGRFVNAPNENARSARVSVAHMPDSGLEVTAARWIFSRSMNFTANK